MPCHQNLPPSHFQGRYCDGKSFVLFGEPSRNRTWNLLIKSSLQQETKAPHEDPSLNKIKKQE